MKKLTLLTILTSQMLIHSALAICIFGFGDCKVQDITNTNKTNIGNVTSQTTVGDTTIGATTVGGTNIGETKINADVIKTFIGSQDANTLFLPLTVVQAKQVENTDRIYKDFKDVLEKMYKSNQDFLKSQAEEQRKFTEELVNKVITGPPTIPVVSASSSFPITLSTNSQSTPLYIKDVDSITNFNNLNNSLNNMSNFITGGGSGTVETLSKSITQTAHGFVAGNWVYLSGASTYAKADADAAATLDSVGVVTAVTDANTFVMVTEGYATGLTGFIAGSRYYISGTAGAITATAPTNAKAVFIADTTTSGYVQQYIPNGVTAEFGENTGITSQTVAIGATYVDVTGSSFTLPSAGVWEVNYVVQGKGNANSAITQVIVTDSTGTDVGNSQSEYNSPALANVQMTLTQTVRISTTASTNYKLQIRTTGATFTTQNSTAASGVLGGVSKITYKKISGFLPSTGSTVDYVGVERRSADVNTNLFTIPSTNTTTFGTLLGTANRVNLSSATISGNLAVNGANGTITIAKSGAYTITTNVSIQSAGTTGQWGQMVKNNATVITASAAYNQAGGAGLQVILTYTGNFTAGDLIDVRVNATAAGSIGVTGYSYNVTQIGSTSNTVGTLPANDQSAAGYFDIGNMRMQWGTHNDGNVDTTTVTLPAPFANTNYSVVATSNTSAGSLDTESKTTTTFDIDRASTTVTTQDYSYFAVGIKP